MSKMQGKAHFSVRALALIACGALATGASFAQSVDQTLDKIDVSSTTDVLGVKQSALPPPPTIGIPYYFGGTLTDVKNCQGSATGGLYCLDGNTVARFPNPDEDFIAPDPLTFASPSRENLVVCDSRIGLVNCSAMTVDLGGNITVAGQTFSATTVLTTHSIVRLRKKAGFCPSGFNEVLPAMNPDYPYCFATLVTGRQPVRDIVAIDGEAGARFTFFSGFLTLEGAADTAGQPFFHPSVQGGTVRTLGNWPNLNQGETFTGVTLVQFRNFSPARNYIAMTTTNGRVFAGLVPSSGSNYRTGLTNLTLTSQQGEFCTSAPVAPPYRLRASARTRTTYFTRGCAVAGYMPAALSNANQSPSLSFNTTPVLAQDTSFVQNGVSVSPGIEVDFVEDRCFEGTVNDPTTFPSDGCNLLRDGNTNSFVAAKFSGLRVVDENAADWTMFQVRNLPDCRYLPVPRTGLCAVVRDSDGVIIQGAVVDSSGAFLADNVRGDPTQQYLNITPLLPPEVTQATVLPTRMLIGPKFRAQQTLDNRTDQYRFDALFGIPEDNLQYTGTFQFTADIADLLGIPQPPPYARCGGAQITDQTVPPPWDVVVNVSELVPTVGGPPLFSEPLIDFATPDTQFVGWLQNGDYCFNPSGSVGVRGSAFVYGLELAPREEKTRPNGTKYWYWPDSTYALLMRSLGKDLNDHIYTYTCQALDGQSGTPVSATDCNQLLKDWVVTYPKLTKCVDATDKPKSSAGNEACQGFESQFGPFKDFVYGLPESPLTDPNNRVGELKARVMILSATYFRQFTPSIKNGGFVDPNF